MLRAAMAQLPKDGVMMLGHTASSRAAALMFATYSADRHPVQGVTEEGVNIRCHTVQCNRRGEAKLRGGYTLAYVSTHALGRLHQRGAAAPEAVTPLLGWIGLLGYLTRKSEQHFESSLCLHFGDVLVCGSLKYGQDRDGVIGFYDVWTALFTNEITNQGMLNQGKVAAGVLQAWSHSRDHSLVAQIPYLPRREDDYTMQAGQRVQQASNDR